MTNHLLFVFESNDIISYGGHFCVFGKEAKYTYIHYGYLITWCICHWEATAYIRFQIVTFIDRVTRHEKVWKNPYSLYEPKSKIYPYSFKQYGVLLEDLLGYFVNTYIFFHIKNFIKWAIIRCATIVYDVSFFQTVEFFRRKLSNYLPVIIYSFSSTEV